MEYDPQTIAANLRVLRARKNISQEALATAIGVDQSTVINWEKGYHTPNFQKMCALADLFEVSLDSIRGKEI